MRVHPAYIEVNETAVLMCGNHNTSEWWLGYRDRAEKVGRVDVLVAGVGDLLRIGCEDKAEAEWLASRLVDKGVPASAVRANRPIPRKVRDASGRGPRRIEPAEGAP